MTRLLALLLLTYSGFNWACSPNSLPVQYVAAIEASDVDKMATFMAPDIHYEDPTMAYFGGDPIDLKGRDETVKFWRDSFRDAKVTKMNYTVLDCFVTKPIVMMNLDLRIDVAGDTWGVNKPQIQLGGRHIMRLKLEQGKIVHQVDYVDYDAVSREVAELQAEFGTTN